jgi:hypothetical protein
MNTSSVTLASRPQVSYPRVSLRRRAKQTVAASAGFLTFLSVVFVPAAATASVTSATNPSPTTVSAATQTPPDSTGGFGISPASILVEDALRGGSASSNVMILNESGRTQTFELTTRGEIADWVTYGEKNEEVRALTVLSEPGRQIARVAIDIPSTARNGTYEGRINVAAISPSDSDPNVVGMSFDLIVTIVVNGEQRVAAAFSNLSIVATEIGQPVTVRASIANSGNVSLPLNVTTEVLRKGALVETLSNSESPQSVDPALSTDVMTVWNTNDALPGDYTVRSTVMAGSLDLGTKEATFRLGESGSLIRSGKLTDFAMIGTPKLSQPLGLLASYTNTGQVATSATLNVSLYQGAKLLSRIKSKPGYVEPGQVVPFEVQTEALPSGTFRAVADVAFDGGSSPKKELTFKVARKAAPLGAALGAGGAVIALGSLALLVARRRRHSRPRRSTASSGTVEAASQSHPGLAPLQPMAKVEPFIPERTGTRRP